MKYDLENESFDYWSDYKEIPFSHLETVARKYVNTFCCTDLYLREETDEETSSGDEEVTSDEETSSEYSNDFHGEDEEDEQDKDNSVEEETKNTETAEDSDDEIFAKLKSAEKIKEVIQEQGTIVNKFRYKGKLMDILEFKQKKAKKDKPKNISFSSWKMF